MSFIKKLKNLKNLIFFLICVSPQNLIAKSSVDIRTEYETWNTGITGKTTAFLLGVGGTHRLNERWSIAAGFVKGGYSSRTMDQESLTRVDADIALGVRIVSNIAIFAGYRFVSIDYKNKRVANRSFDDKTHGIGVGVSGFYSVLPKTYVYGRLSLSGLVSRINANTRKNDRGLGFNSGLELGVIYQFIDRASIGISLKQQSASIDYKNNSRKWNHNYLRSGVSLSYYF